MYSILIMPTAVFCRSQAASVPINTLSNHIYQTVFIKANQIFIHNKRIRGILTRSVVHKAHVGKIRRITKVKQAYKRRKPKKQLKHNDQYCTHVL